MFHSNTITTTTKTTSQAVVQSVDIIQSLSSEIVNYK